MFDTTRFLRDNFIDVDGVVGLLARHWPEIPRREAVRKWFARSSITSEWWPALLIALEIENGEPVSLAQYALEEVDVFA